MTAWKHRAVAPFAIAAALAVLGGGAGGVLALCTRGRLGRLPGGRTWTTDERVQAYESAVRARLDPAFRAARVPFPPASFVLLAFKEERVLELHAPRADGSFGLVRAYPILAASGRAGPKLRRGDEQVPEGVYGIESLNPNSRFHLSLRVSYPNPDDRRRAASEGRDDLGGDIMIHGGAVSVGCLAMGDEVAEELFVLTALTGVATARVVIAPRDLRSQPAATPDRRTPGWVAALYEELRGELARYPERAGGG